MWSWFSALDSQRLCFSKDFSFLLRDTPTLAKSGICSAAPWTSHLEDTHLAPDLLLLGECGAGRDVPAVGEFALVQVVPADAVHNQLRVGNQLLKQQTLTLTKWSTGIARFCVNVGAMLKAPYPELGNCSEDFFSADCADIVIEHLHVQYCYINSGSLSTHSSDRY